LARIIELLSDVGLFFTAEIIKICVKKLLMGKKMKKTVILFGLLMLTSNVTLADANPQQFEKCLAAALEERPGQVVKVELKNVEGNKVYEFDIRGIDGSDWDVACNALRGVISEVEREVDNVNHPLFKVKAKLNEADARETALAIYPGEIVEAPS